MTVKIHRMKKEIYKSKWNRQNLTWIYQIELQKQLLSVKFLHSNPRIRMPQTETLEKWEHVVIQKCLLWERIERYEWFTCGVASKFESGYLGWVELWEFSHQKMEMEKTQERGKTQKATNEQTQLELPNAKPLKMGNNR